MPNPELHITDCKDMDISLDKAPNTALGLALTSSASPCKESSPSALQKTSPAFPSCGPFMNFLASPSHFNLYEDVCARPSPPLPLELLPLKPTSHKLLSLSSSPPSQNPSFSSSMPSPLRWQHPIGACASISRNFLRGLDMNQRPVSGDHDEIAMGMLSQGTVATAAARTSENSLLLMKPQRERSSETAQERACEVSSRGSDEEGEGGGSARKKLRLSKEQSTLLEESFKEHNTLNPKQKAELAKQLNLRPRQVEVWFQNRRARTKLKQTEVDCELLRRCYESLTDENRRLQKEVAELRAIKMAPPCVISPDFFMPLPAATLSICPSCQRVASRTPAAPPHAAAPSSESPSTHPHFRPQPHLPQLSFPHPPTPPHALPSAAC